MKVDINVLDRATLNSENVPNIDGITHTGTFHADEVMATAILVLFKESMSDKKGTLTHFNVVRCSDNDAHQLRKIEICQLKRAGIGTPDAYQPTIYDIGGGRYDHHQKGGNGRRENGVPYASAGLIWRKYGYSVVSERAEVDTDDRFLWIHKYVDKNLIQGIDAEDCGTMVKPDYPCYPMTVNDLIRMMNPTNDTVGDSCFIDAVQISIKILETVIDAAIKASKDRDDVQSALRCCKNQILCLPNYMSWIDHIFDTGSPLLQKKADRILYVVYPAKRGGFQWRVVPTAPGSFDQRNHVPTSWLGLKGKDLQDVTGIPTAKFVHANGFIGGADTFADCYNMAEQAIKLGWRDCK